MMECPRCGFTQPDDRYCANCGLDSHSYNPEPPPWYQRSLKNPFFHMGLALVLLAGITVYIAQPPQQKEPKPPPSTTTDSSSPQQADHSQTVETATSSPAREQSTKEKGAQDELKEPKKAQGESNDRAQKERPQGQEPPEAQATQQSSAQARPPESFALRYYSIPGPLLQRLFEKGQVIRETRHISSLVFKDTKNLTGLLQAAQELEGGRDIPIKGDSPQTVDFMYQGTARQREAPLHFELQPVNVTANEVEFEFSGRLILPTANGEDITTHQFQSSYVINATDAILIAGFIPRRRLPQAVAESLPPGPLDIMTSESFLREQNPHEFLLMLQPQ